MTQNLDRAVPTAKAENACAPVSTAQIARAIYEAMNSADRAGHIGPYEPGRRTTIDGRFNLSKVAARLRKELGL